MSYYETISCLDIQFCWATCYLILFQGVVWKEEAKDYPNMNRKHAVTNVEYFGMSLKIWLGRVKQKLVG